MKMACGWVGKSDIRKSYLSYVLGHYLETANSIKHYRHHIIHYRRHCDLRIQSENKRQFTFHSSSLLYFICHLVNTSLFVFIHSFPFDGQLTPVNYVCPNPKCMGVAKNYTRKLPSRIHPLLGIWSYISHREHIQTIAWQHLLLSSIVSSYHLTNKHTWTGLISFISLIHFYIHIIWSYHWYLRNWSRRCAVYGLKILYEISKSNFEISHKMLNPCAA